MSTDALLAILRQDFHAFADRALFELEGKHPREGSRHVELICRTLAQLHAGELTRLVINQPPRTLKSFLGAVALPAWTLGHDPKAQIIIACHDERLAETHADKVRQIMRSDIYQAAFPATRLRTDFSGRDQFKTDVGGQVLAISLAGGVTGQGADLLVIDDPIDARKVASEAERDLVNKTIVGSLMQRLQSQLTSRVLLLQQRLHENDSSGYLARERAAFEHLAVPLIAPEDYTYTVGAWSWVRKAGDVLDRDEFPDAVIEDLRQNPAMFAAQYQQDPTADAAAVVRADSFPLYESVPPGIERYVMSFDTAMKASGGSFSVCLVFKTNGRDHYLENVWRDRLDYPFLEAKALELARRYRPAYIVIEDATYGGAIGFKLEAEFPGKVHREKPNGSKLARLQAVCDVINGGHVHVPRLATFTKPFLDEVCGFPGSANDDQVDALSQFLKVMREVGPRMLTEKVILGSGPAVPHRHPMRDPNGPPLNYVPTGRVGIGRLTPGSFRR